MRFVVYGAGAIGGVVGGRLFEAGHDVVLIARGAHGQAIQADGLRLESPAGSAVLPVPAAGHPKDIDWRDDDVVLISVKSQATAGVVHELAMHASPATPVVSLQNGVSNEPTALRLFHHVYAVCVMLPAAHLEPGVVQAQSSPVTGMLDIGRFPAGVDDTARAIADALGRSTFLCELRPDIMRWKYRKLVMNLANAVQALCGPSERTPELSKIREALEAEATACFEAARIEVATKDEDRERRADHLKVQSVGAGTPSGNSSWQSLQRSTGSIETDYLNGQIGLLGRLHDVPTPTNDLLQRLSNRAARERVPPGNLSHADLLEMLGI